MNEMPDANNMSDPDAYAYYADPENREPIGEGRRRERPAMSSHVPVRFPPEMVAEVKHVAREDRKTVSSWIRDVVERELRRRRPQYPRTGSLVREEGLKMHGWEEHAAQSRTGQYEALNAV